MRTILIMLSLLFLLFSSTAFAVNNNNVVDIDNNYGYYIDGTGQVEEYQRIPPPNEQNLPIKPTTTVKDFNMYHRINIRGARRADIMTPYVPNYNIYYNNYRAEPYTKDEWIKTWCNGRMDVKGVDCQTNKYNIKYVRARDWTFGVINIPFVAKRNKKQGKETAIWLMVDDLGADAKHMSDALRWAEVYNVQVFFSTIDSYIPHSWILY